MSLLFGLGLTITITLYSVAVALIGQALGLEKATMIMYIAAGDVAYGAALGIVNGVGRSVPLIFLSILAILGVNAAKSLLKKKETIDKGVGWGLVWIGSIILTLGIFGHYWLLKTGTHTAWNKIFATAVGGRTAEYSCCIEPPCKQCLTDNMFGPNTCRGQDP